LTCKTANRKNLFSVGKILERKKARGCRWQKKVKKSTLEFWDGCKNKIFGDPKFIRSHSGSCNNLTPGQQHWGLYGLPLARLQPADYSGST
jgi:hypothetical protein